jgi:hypothetical protein
VKTLIVLLVLIASIGSAKAQRCDSLNIHLAESGWKTIDSAPKDGTVLEGMQTYGIAPYWSTVRFVNNHWVSGIDAAISLEPSTCLMWRPLKVAVLSYQEPTLGKQDTTGYWCDAMRLEWLPSINACVKPAFSNPLPRPIRGVAGLANVSYGQGLPHDKPCRLFQMSDDKQPVLYTAYAECSEVDGKINKYVSPVPAPLGREIFEPLK